jgi:23S rRNA (cytidine1920-2'-O)/16S rRNA (cytidine1409-2'-O)-methyltransferase
MNAKKRLDILMVERELAPTREKARGLIMAGEVLVNDAMIDKPGAQIAPESIVVVKARPRFVSRGGEKLAAALSAFNLDVTGRICADVGASTGGFTDCLLQHGAARVYAIDVGYGQMAYPLRQDARVVMLERTNARYLETLAESVSFVSVDASFISLRLLLPVVRGWLTPHAVIVPLIKPQFEAGVADVGKGGVVRDRRVHVRVLEEILTFAAGQNLRVESVIRSPLLGPAGNIEFLAHLTWDAAAPPPTAIPSFDSFIERALE